MFHEFSIDYRVSIRSFHYLASRGIDWTAIETDLLDRSDTNLYRRPSKLRSFEDKAGKKMIRNLLEHYSLRIKEERELLEFREIDELLCRDPESSIETEKKKNRVPEISITGEGKSDNVARFRYNGASTNLPQNNTSLRDRVQAWLHLTQEWRIERVKFFRWNLYPCFTGIYRNFIWIKLSFQLTPLNFVLDIFCK